jgi:hypothetical protein
LWGSEASFHNTVCPQGWNLPPRGELGPQSEICLLGGMFTPLFTPRGEHSLLYRTLTTVYKNGVANKEFHPQGITSPLGDKNHNWETTSPLGVKGCPWGRS